MKLNVFNNIKQELKLGFSVSTLYVLLSVAVKKPSVMVSILKFLGINAAKGVTGPFGWALIGISVIDTA